LARERGRASGPPLAVRGEPPLAGTGTRDGPGPRAPGAAAADGGQAGKRTRAVDDRPGGESVPERRVAGVPTRRPAGGPDRACRRHPDVGATKSTTKWPNPWAGERGDRSRDRGCRVAGPAPVPRESLQGGRVPVEHGGHCPQEDV